jgi:hypothetical protein
MQLYHGARLLYLRELRLSKKLDEAQRVLDEILGTPKAPGWGQRNLEVQKEKLSLLEDRELYAGAEGAILGWNRLMKSIRPRIQQDAKMKETYFDCYYHLTTSHYQNALRMADGKRKDDAIKRSAGLLRKLEDAEPDLTAELKQRIKNYLDRETILKSEYKKQGGTVFLSVGG